MDSRLPGSQLLNVYCRNALLRQCKGSVRRGELRIDGCYHPAVIQGAFDDCGDWSLFRKGGWSHGILEIRDQSTLARMLSFQVIVSSFRHAHADAALVFLGASQMLIGSCMQDLSGCSASKRANGCYAVSSRGDGWAWICCEQTPFKISHSRARTGPHTYTFAATSRASIPRCASVSHACVVLNASSFACRLA